MAIKQMNILTLQLQWAWLLSFFFFILLGPFMYTLCEDWKDLESFYFVFIFISTIGFDYVLPAHPNFFYHIFSLYTHGNKLGNTSNNVTNHFGLYLSFFVKVMKNVLTLCQNLQYPKLFLC